MRLMHSSCKGLQFGDNDDDSCLKNKFITCCKGDRQHNVWKKKVEKDLLYSIASAAMMGLVYVTEW